jgi:regulatory protein
VGSGVAGPGVANFGPEPGGGGRGRGGRSRRAAVRGRAEPGEAVPDDVNPEGADPGDAGSGGIGRGGIGPGGAGPGGAGPGGAGPGGAGPGGAGPGGAGPGGAGPGGAGLGGGGSGGVEPGSEEAARAICLRLLTSAPRTRAQLATALRKRGIPGEVAESVLGRFAEVGLIDDAAFARAWVESRHHGRGLARRALSAELRQRGVPDREVRSAVGMLGPQDELDAARRLVAKRVVATRGKPMPARARQLMGMLARKGYPAGLAAQVVREALEQDQEDGPDPRADLAWISEAGSGDDWP